MKESRGAGLMVSEPDGNAHTIEGLRRRKILVIFQDLAFNGLTVTDHIYKITTFQLP